MSRTLYTALAAASLVVGLLILVVALTGLFWPATPVGDIGMWSTVGMFLLLGVLGMLLARRFEPAA